MWYSKNRGCTKSSVTAAAGEPGLRQDEGQDELVLALTGLRAGQGSDRVPLGNRCAGTSLASKRNREDHAGEADKEAAGL